MALFPDDDFDPSQPKPNPVQLPYAKSERVKGGTIKCYSLAERDAIPVEWREEGTTIAFVDNDWGDEGAPEVPEGGWLGQPDPADPEAALPEPDERPAAPAPPGRYYVLRDGITNACWVPFGGSGDGGGSYTNPGIEAGINGCVAGTAFDHTPFSEVFDRIFSLSFNATAVITALTVPAGGAGAIVAANGEFFYEKGTLVDVAVTGTASVVADTITGRVVTRSLTAPGPVALPGTNSFTVADAVQHGPRNQVGYALTVSYAGHAQRTSAVRFLTPVGPSYYGVVNTLTPSEATMKAFGKHTWANGNQALSFTASSQRAAFARPQSLGPISKITDATGSDIYYDAALPDAVNAFVRTAVTYTLLDGGTEPYWLYVKKSVAGTGTPFTYVFVD